MWDVGELVVDVVAMLYGRCMDAEIDEPDDELNEPEAKKYENNVEFIGLDGFNIRL